jgi:hypothetical protein
MSSSSEDASGRASGKKKRTASEREGLPNILLLGKTGAGKSTFCVTAKASFQRDAGPRTLRGKLVTAKPRADEIIEKDTDIVIGGHTSTTKEVSKFECLAEHKSYLAGYNLIDTPGLLDGDREDQKIIDMMLVRLKREEKLDHVVIFSDAGVITPADYGMFRDYLKFLGQPDGNKVTVVFTYESPYSQAQWHTRQLHLQKRFGESMSVERWMEGDTDGFKNLCDVITDNKDAVILPSALVRIESLKTMVCRLETEEVTAEAAAKAAAGAAQEQQRRVSHAVNAKSASQYAIRYLSLKNVMRVDSKNRLLRALGIIQRSVLVKDADQLLDACLPLQSADRLCAALLDSQPPATLRNIVDALVTDKPSGVPSWKQQGRKWPHPWECDRLRRLARGLIHTTATERQTKEHGF